MVGDRRPAPRPMDPDALAPSKDHAPGPVTFGGLPSGPRPVTLTRLPDGTVQAHSGPLGPATPRGVPKALGEDPRLGGLLQAAVAKDQILTADPLFRGALDQFLSSKPVDWLNLGSKEAGIVSILATAQARATELIQIANAPHWLDLTKEAYQGRVSFLDKLQGLGKPAHYKAMLANAKVLLVQAVEKYTELEGLAQPAVKKLSLYVLILTVAEPTVTEVADKQLLTGRLRTLVTAQATLGQLAQTVTTGKMQAVTQLQSVDQALTNIIPLWEAACK